MRTAFAPQTKEIKVTLRDVISVKTALAALLVEETSYMDTMQIRKVGELQERKLKLTGLLERYTRYLHQNPHIAAEATPLEKTELQEITHRLHTAMKVNYDTLLVARSVNGAIVKCVTQIVSKKDRNPTYNALGSVPEVLQCSPISVTLNQII